jgi:hypothetical protein
VTESFMRRSKLSVRFHEISSRIQAKYNRYIS